VTFTFIRIFAVVKMLKLVVTFCLVAAATAHFDYARCATGQCFGAPEGCIDAKVVFFSKVEIILFTYKASSYVCTYVCMWISKLFTTIKVSDPHVHKKSARTSRKTREMFFDFSKFFCHNVYLSFHFFYTLCKCLLLLHKLINHASEVCNPTFNPELFFTQKLLFCRSAKTSEGSFF
jgi:hypothetical protein